MSEPDAMILRCPCAIWAGWPTEAGRCCRRCHGPLCILEHYDPTRRGECSSCLEAGTKAAHAKRPPARKPAAESRPSTTDNPKADRCEAANHSGLEPARRASVRRQPRHYRTRHTVFAYDEPTAARQLEQLEAGTQRVYLVGAGRSEADRVAWIAGELPDGWSHDPTGHYIAGPAPVFRFRRANGERVELLRAGAWCDDTGASLEAVAGAFAGLEQLVAKLWPGSAVLASPSATGRALLMESQTWQAEWPTLPEELADLIRATSGQARIETWQHAGDLPALVEYDARFAYAAVCWQLPAGTPTRDTADTFAGYDPARYRVAWRVPDGWNHVGILPTFDSEAGTWRWPAKAGERATGWVDGSELLLAVRHGWHVRILERIVWPRYTTRGPLDTWSRKLVAARAAVIEQLRVGAIEADRGRMVADMLRSIVLHTIGALQGRPQAVTVIADSPAAKPATATGWRRAGSRHVWNEHRPPAWPAMIHPEWSAAIWARARARLLDAPTGTPGIRAGALHVPASTLVAARTDALYMTADPAWPDDGKAGRYRRVMTLPGPMPAPANGLELLELKARANA